MNSILQQITNHKQGEIDAAKSKVSLSSIQSLVADQPPALDFFDALQSGTNGVRPDSEPLAKSLRLIAEVKKASPSKGIIRADFDPVAIAKTYERSGADCISVLTDEKFFQGHLDYLKAIRQAVDIPLLRKDFILEEYQVWEARAAGADAVLLIAECLDSKQLYDLNQAILGLGMTPLIELYHERNLDAVLQCNPQLIGINNRDLDTFVVDLRHSIRLRQQIPAEILVVSESGIETAADVSVLAGAGIAAMLVGESLIKQPDIAAAVRQLIDPFVE